MTIEVWDTPKRRFPRVSLTSVLVVVYLCVLIYAALPDKRNPQVIVMWVCRGLMVASQQGAYVLGRVAIGAERAYWMTAERARGGF